LTIRTSNPQTLQVSTENSVNILSLPVIAAALGYFVDIYDLLLFSIIRIKSLKALGLSDLQCDTEGKFIISLQMYGFIIGGIIWGILGDKKGRISILFGSIILYSLTNIANGLVQNTDQYAIARFFSGIGLSGELGASITLVSELVSKEKRSRATSLISGFGLIGAVAAYFVARWFDWRVAYFLGGALGLCLLFLRLQVFESGMFEKIQRSDILRGDFFMLFNSRRRFKNYILSILLGLPSWYVVGILFTFSREFATRFKFQNAAAVDPGRLIMFAYITGSVGSFSSGFISHWMKSRKKAFVLFYAWTSIFIILYFFQQGGTPEMMYLITMTMGFGTGFWALFVTMAAEHFGTNLRATAATTVPNMARGSLPLMLIIFESIEHSAGYIAAGAITGIIVMGTSFFALYMTEETYGKDLNFIET